MRILYIIHEGKLGGATKSVITLGQIMKAKGYKVCALLPHKKSEAKRELEINGITVYSSLFLWWQYPRDETLLNQWLFKIGYWFNYVFFQRIKSILKNDEFDIVHSNSSVIDIGAKIANHKKCKHIWHFREFGEDDLNTRYIKGKKKSMQFATKYTDRFIFISNDIRKAFSEYLPKEKSIVIYNGISSDFVCEKDANIYCRDSKVNFLVSGALQEGKGQMLAILAANELKEKGLKNFKVYIAGRAITNYANEVKKLVDELELNTFVEFLGFCNDIQQIRRKMDVEIVCSNREAFGRVTVEAMMCSNPVIASNSGANPELIANMETGLLFNNNDFIDLGDKMRYFIENTNKIYLMGKQAFDFSRENFTAEKNAYEIDKLYTIVVNEKRVN